jgi:hypothetical protein
MLKRFAVLAAVAAVITVVVLVASGGGGDTQLVSGDALAQAARTTEKVPGASMTADAVIEVEGVSKPLTMHLEGVSDMRRGSGRLAGEYKNFPTKLPGASADGTIPVEMVVLKPDLYFKSPLFGSTLPDGKSWLHIDLAKTGKQLGVGDPTQFGQSDPTQTLDNLRATSGRVEKVGTEDVRGVKTTHYRATIELDKLPSLVPQSERATARARTQKLIALTGTHSYPMEVWIDGRHLVRRTAFTMHMTVEGRSMSVKTTSEMYDFGPKPKTKRPPASETYEAPQP